jgi:hypothetical protein
MVLRYLTFEAKSARMRDTGESSPTEWEPILSPINSALSLEERSPAVAKIGLVHRFILGLIAATS